MTQATIDALRAYIERQAAVTSAIADALEGTNPGLPAEAQTVVNLADDATDALANEPVEDP